MPAGKDDSSTVTSVRTSWEGLTSHSYHSSVYDSGDARPAVSGCEASLTVTRETGIWTLEARLAGAPVDQERQELRNDVKGITKHLYELKQDGPRWRARVVLDV